MVKTVELENASKQQYIEALRIFASFAVVLIHVAGTYLDEYAVGATEWYSFVILDSITRWSVPVFVMISGAVTLGKGYTFEKVAKKALRFTFLFFLWSFVYAVFYFALGDRLKFVFTTAVTGAVHLWYLPLTVGLYLMIPVFERIIEDEKLTRYVLVIGAAVGFVLPTIGTVLKIVNPFLGKIMTNLIDMFKLPMIVGYPVYFILGKKLSSIKISKRGAIALYCGGGLSIIISVAGNLLASRNGVTELCFAGTGLIFVFCQSASIFLFFRDRKLPMGGKVTGYIAEYSFGIYLIHYFFTVLLGRFISFPVQRLVISGCGIILGMTIMIYIVSLVIVAVAKRIPILNRIM